MCGRLIQIGYLIPGFRVSFRVWGGFDFRCFRFFVFSRSVLFRSLSASFGLLLLSWPERLRDCLGLSWGSVWGGFRSTRKPGIKLPRALNISWTFSLLADQNKSRKLASGVPFGERRQLSCRLRERSEYGWSFALTRHLYVLQDGPKWPQDGPKICQNSPKIGQKWPPRWPKMAITATATPSPPLSPTSLPPTPSMVWARFWKASKKAQK